MSGNRRKYSYRAGFTLLELLVSIAIFAVVISSVYGAYRATFHTIGGTDQQVLRAAAARVILERVTEDLEALSTGENSYFIGETNQLDDGRADSLKFLSSAHLVFNREEMPMAEAGIEYQVREAEGEGLELIRIDTPVLPGQQDLADDEAAGEILGKGLLSFSLSYFNEDGEQVEDWQSGEEIPSDAEGGEPLTLELPALVRVEIIFLAENENSQPSLFRTSIALPKVYTEQEQQEGEG